MSSESAIDQCVGRFRFKVPDSLLITGRSQSIYDVDVSTVPIPSGGIQMLWDSRLAQIRGLTAPHGFAQTIVRSFELQPGAPSVWYLNDPYNPKIREIAVLKPVGTHAMFVVTGGEAGKEALIERLVTNVLNAYSDSDSQGFCLGKGAVISEPGFDERALISLAPKSPDSFKLTLSTQTVEQPDTKTYSSIDEEKQMITASRGSITVLRDQHRSAAGLTGKEIWVSVTLPEQPPFLRFTWHFPGVPRDAVQPMINIKATASTANRRDLEDAWNLVMQSFRRIPVSK